MKGSDEMTDEVKSEETAVEPTEASPQAVAAATETAHEGGSPEQAERAAAREERDVRPELTDAETKKIASGLVDELEARGMFEEPSGAEPNPLPAASDATSQAAEPATAEAGSDEQPRKRTFYEWFAGVK